MNKKKRRDKTIMKWLKKLWENRKAIGMNEVVVMGVSFFLVAILGPIAIGTIFNATTSGWNTTVVTVFQVLLPILWTIGVAVKYIPRGK